MKRRVSFASGDHLLPISNVGGGPYGADIIPVAPRPQGNQRVLERLTRSFESSDVMPDGTRGGPFGTVISSSHYIPRVAPTDPCKPDGSRYLSVGRDTTGRGAKGAWVRQAMQRYRRHGNAANQPDRDIDALSILRNPEDGTASDVAGKGMDLEGEGWWDDFSKGANSVLRPVLTAASFVPGPVGLAATAADLLRQGTMGNQTLYGGDFGADPALEDLEGEGWFDDLKKGFNTIASPVLTIASKAPGPIGMAATAANLLRKGTLGEDKYWGNGLAGGDMTDGAGADTAVDSVPGAPPAPGESTGPIPENVVNSNESWEAWLEQQAQAQSAPEGPTEDAGNADDAAAAPTADAPGAASTAVQGEGLKDMLKKGLNTVLSPIIHGAIDTGLATGIKPLTQAAALANFVRYATLGNDRYIGKNDFKKYISGGTLAGGDMLDDEEQEITKHLWELAAEYSRISSVSSPENTARMPQLMAERDALLKRRKEILEMKAFMSHDTGAAPEGGSGLAGGAKAGGAMPVQGEGWFDDLKKGFNTIASPVLTIASKAPGPIGMAATAANLLRKGTLGEDKFWGNGLAGGAPAGGAMSGGAEAGGALSGGGRKRRRFNPESRTAKRAAVVSKIMKERKCSLVEASRIVKNEKIEY